MRKVTINDVARAAKVSLQTVSRVINDKKEVSPATRRRVQRVINDLSYRPSQLARSLATKRTYTLGLVIPDITNPFFPAVVLGAEQVAIKNGYSLILCNTGEDEARERAALQLLGDKNVDGIVVFSARMSDASLVPLLKPYKAAVLFNRHSKRNIAGVVRIDDNTGIKLAVRHLYDSNRRHIAYLAGPKNSQSGRERLKSVRIEFRKLGADAKVYISAYCAPNFEGGLESARDLLTQHPKIDAFICYNDMVAVGVLQACSDKMRRVPDDIAIVGHDDILLARYVTPPLTTLRVPAYEVGRMVIEMAINRILGKPEPSEIQLTPELVIRASSASNN
jgi:LacI family transcriptional regulator